MKRAYKYKVKRHFVIQPTRKPYRFIPLTQGQNAIVDVTDFEWLSQWNWCAYWDSKMSSFYAERRVRKGITIRMHSFILGCKAGQEVDHRNHNTLDNRRKNLRKATRKQNGANRRLSRNNSSGYKGVSWNKVTGKWQSNICVSYKLKHIGLFISAKEAAMAYDAEALKHFGEFAHTNFARQYA